MKQAPFLFSRLAAVSLMLCMSACSWMKIPKVTMPSLPDVKVPFVSDDSTAPGNDPLLPWTLKDRLAPGHTLKIAAFAGQRSPDKIFSGSIMVDDEGRADVGRYGKLKLGGLNATQAVLALEGAFRKKRGESIINVHVENIEQRPLLQVHGAVVQEGVIQFFDGSNPVNILPYAGGHDPKKPGRAVHVTRKGVRRFYADYASAGVSLEAGDIVIYSEDL